VFTANFKEEVLIAPLLAGYDSLLAVVGYATPAAALQHLTGGSNPNPDPHFHEHGSLRLVHGMYSSDGITRSDHELFVNLQHRQNFECRYNTNLQPIHAKVYVWSKNGHPELAFVGSGNYSQAAIRSRTLEIFERTDPVTAYSYCQDIFEKSTPCNAIIQLQRRDEYASVIIEDVSTAVPPEVLSKCKHVKLPLTEFGRGLVVPASSGINWGQREGREPNQAYLSVPAKINRRQFFPDRGEFFSVLTDDGRTFEMSRNQDEGKALHTPNNSVLGRYLRERLGVPFDSFVTIEHLKAYGRLDVDFYYLGNDTYYMDFSQKNPL